MKNFIFKFVAVLMNSVFLFYITSSVCYAGTLNLSSVNTKEVNYKKYYGKKQSINVYNWGEFLSDGYGKTLAVNKEFEKLTGIKVNYSTFASNEELYAKMRNKSVKYDVIIPSDYMISRMIEEDLLMPLDFAKIANFKNVDENFKNLEYDVQGKYSVPYMWGMVGIIYNKKYIKKEINSWASLWDEDYSGKILMFSNSRDSFGLALKKLNYSVNSKNKSEILAASLQIAEQKKLVQAYVMDEIFNKMENEEAIIAPYYSGDAITMMKENRNLEFVYPKEGTNKFVDAICIPKDSENAEVAYLYINFLLEPQVALANVQYTGYSTPNKGAFKLLDDETKNNKIAYPDDEILKQSESFLYLSPEINKCIDSEWVKIMSLNDDDNKWFIPALLLFCVTVSVFINVYRACKKRRKF